MSHLLDAVGSQTTFSDEFLKKACFISCTPLNIFPTPTKSSAGNYDFTHELFDKKGTVVEMNRNDIGEAEFFRPYFFALMKIYISQVDPDAWALYEKHSEAPVEFINFSNQYNDIDKIIEDLDSYWFRWLKSSRCKAVAA